MLNWIPLLLYFKSKNEYSGSHLGMRYGFGMGKQKQTDADGNETEVTCLDGIIWPEPWAREYTDPALFVKKVFPFTVEGRQQAIDWLSEVYYADEDRWKVVPSILDCEPWHPAPQPEQEDAAANS